MLGVCSKHTERAKKLHAKLYGSKEGGTGEDAATFILQIGLSVWPRSRRTRRRRRRRTNEQEEEERRRTKKKKKKEQEEEEEEEEEEATEVWGLPSELLNIRVHSESALGICPHF